MRRITTVAVLLALAAPAAAIDRPLAGDRLELRDGPTTTQRSVRVGAVRARTPLVDPRASGGTLEIAGSDAGDGATGALPLDAGRWHGLGTPAGTDGYAWSDPGRARGLRRVVLRRRGGGVRLVVRGGGAGWPYAVTQAQGPVDVRVRLGDDVYCAHFDTFRQNLPGR